MVLRSGLDPDLFRRFFFLCCVGVCWFFLFVCLFGGWGGVRVFVWFWFLLFLVGWVFS